MKKPNIITVVMAIIVMVVIAICLVKITNFPKGIKEVNDRQKTADKIRNLKPRFVILTNNLN
ncbi:hypothetical protein [Epilithonimonas hungarica]|uniref:Uncharacterized protein n=1 Tax=Epilithonimonas hungarica TaxID=454006 RepID=A0A1G7F8Z6_9FLAO|nr:hypothetical protein [Epilithonimonas hungarica]SDE72420.1 hypothetical protein SAMN05421825_0020 [Epilithonimonas hungarica]